MFAKKGKKNLLRLEMCISSSVVVIAVANAVDGNGNDNGTP